MEKINLLIGSEVVSVCKKTFEETYTADEYTTTVKDDVNTYYLVHEVTEMVLVMGIKDGAEVTEKIVDTGKDSFFKVYDDEGGAHRFTSKAVAKKLKYLHTAGDGSDYYHKDNSRSRYDSGYHLYSYHSQHRGGSEPQDGITIGIEVEKVDRTSLVKHSAHHVREQTGWIKESDSSLDSGGYEMVSPRYNLYSDKILKDIKNNELLRELLNASVNNSCGGHIHLKFPAISDDDMFRSISGFIPLIYAMHPKRIAGRYCKMKTDRGTTDYKEKYQGVRFTNGRIELRMFNSPKDIRELETNILLIRYMCSNIGMSTADIYKELLTPSSELRKLVQRSFTAEAMKIVVNTFVYLAQIYFDTHVALESYTRDDQGIVSHMGSSAISQVNEMKSSNHIVIL